MVLEVVGVILLLFGVWFAWSAHRAGKRPPVDELAERDRRRPR